MDDYIEPKDSKKFLWGDLNSPLSTNKYSDDEDDDSYSLPYQPVPGRVIIIIMIVMSVFLERLSM